MLAQNTSGRQSLPWPKKTPGVSRARSALAAPALSAAGLSFFLCLPGLIFLVWMIWRYPFSPSATVIISLGSVLYGSWHYRHLRRILRAKSQSPTAFERIVPCWGKVGAPADFEDYLRDQLSVAVELVASDPDETKVHGLVKYIASLLSDRYGRHEVQVAVALPAAWPRPEAWKPKDGTILFEEWLVLTSHAGDYVEIACQPFRQDTTIVRLSPITKRSA
jgi:hypothetical protein